MSTYLTDTLLNYTQDTGSTYITRDYTSIDMSKIAAYIATIDSTMITYYRLEDDCKLEKVSLDIYGVPDYWDVLLILNNRNPLFEFPVNYDAILSQVDYMLADYATNVVGGTLSADTTTELTASFTEKLLADKEVYRIIKIIQPGRISEFLQGGYDYGCFI